MSKNVRSSMASSNQFLSGVRAVIIEQGLGKTRQKILREKLTENGGVFVANLNEPDVSHVIVNKTTRPLKLPRLLNVDKVPESVTVVSAEWLSQCLVEGQRVNTDPFLVTDQQCITPMNASNHIHTPLVCTSSSKTSEKVTHHQALSFNCPL